MSGGVGGVCGVGGLGGAGREVGGVCMVGANRALISVGGRKGAIKHTSPTDKCSYSIVLLLLF